MVLTATTAVAGTALDRGLQTVNLATRLWSLQPIKGLASRNRTSVKLQRRCRVGGPHIGYCAAQSEAEVERNGAELSQLTSDSSAAPQESSKTLDEPAWILALFPKGSNAAVCGGVAVLPEDITSSYNDVVDALTDKAAMEDAPELNKELDLVMKAYGPVLEDIKEANKNKESSFPEKTLKNVDKAADSATEFFGWAKRIVSDKLSGSGALTKQARLQVVPYIVVLSYVTRIRVITRLVERDNASNKSEKERHIDRASDIVDDFVEVVYLALEKLMPNTSLLEIALDYELPMAMYLTLITSFRHSVGANKSPSTDPNGIAAFDDGLSSIRDEARLAMSRDALHWKPSDADDQDQSSTIDLSIVNESLWWARFTGTDTRTADLSKLRKSIKINELSHELGATSGDIVAQLALKQDQKNALMQLPPASTLRATLCANIDQALQAAPECDRRSLTPPFSFACTSAPPPPRSSLPSSSPISESAPLQAADPRTLNGHSSPVYAVAVYADGKRMVSGSRDNTAKVWDLRSGQAQLTYSKHRSEVNCVAVIPDGEMAVSGSADKSVHVWRIESGNEQKTLKDHSDRVWAVASSRDGRTIASGSADKTVKIWNIYTGQCQHTLGEHREAVMCVAFSPDEETVVSGSCDTMIHVWGVRTRELQLTLRGHSKDVLSVAVTPDGSRLVSGSADKTVRVWDLSSGKEEMKFEGHSGEVSCVAVFPDGQRIVSGSGDKSIRVWNLHSQKAELTLMGHSKRVQCVAVSPDGQSIVSGSWDNTIKVWDLNQGGGNGAAR